MAETIDLTGDGGVIKTIVRRPKPDAVAPSESLPLVDGSNQYSKLYMTCFLRLYVHCFNIDMLILA